MFILVFFSRMIIHFHFLSECENLINVNFSIPISLWYFDCTINNMDNGTLVSRQMIHIKNGRTIQVNKQKSGIFD
jgi:hypothetical protein